MKETNSKLQSFLSLNQAKMTSTDSYVPFFEPHALPAYSYGLPFDEALEIHLSHRQISRPYFIVSGTMCRTTDVLPRVEKVLKTLGIKAARVKQGIPPHSLHSDILSITAEIKATNADGIVGIGGGSIGDSSKAIAVVSLPCTIGKKSSERESLMALHQLAELWLTRQTVGTGE
jgi:alcohol dehydrogenase class IV